METSITYIHCGIDGWCYCFNILDVFTRRWGTYLFDTTATAQTTVQSVLKAIASAGENVPNLRISTYNGP